jgi:hypothetical protein
MQKVETMACFPNTAVGGTIFQIGQTPLPQKETPLEISKISSQPLTSIASS